MPRSFCWFCCAAAVIYVFCLLIIIFLAILGSPRLLSFVSNILKDQIDFIFHFKVLLAHNPDCMSLRPDITQFAVSMKERTECRRIFKYLNLLKNE